MSKVSIYETSWLNLVFEGKNQQYGAYQLRRQSDRTTMIAFFSGLLLITAAVGIPALISRVINPEKVQIAVPEFLVPIKLSDIHPNQPKPAQKLVLPVQKKTVTDVDSKHLKDPIIVKPIDATPNLAVNKDPQTTTTTEGTGTIPASNPMPSNGGSGTGTETPSATPSNTPEMTAALDRLPEFPGGMDKLRKYVATNFEKPEMDVEQTIRVYVSFVIERDGTMTDIQVRRDPGYGLAKEAIRVLKSLKTKWEPGMIAGKPVRTAYNLPITVKME
ncbi:MAG TPA: energy transducer TonB [Flavobacterium sp.]|nr:energy transducer TonB [Flavobacterium sp.]